MGKSNEQECDIPHKKKTSTIRLRSKYTKKETDYPTDFFFF